MRCLLLLVFVLIIGGCIAVQFRQEAAKITHCNTKYVTGCYAITRRAKRGEIYKTNGTTTIRNAWGNNVTMRMILYSDGLTVEVIKLRLCDIVKVKWLYDYLQTYSNAGDECPYKAGFYGIYNMEFPPKNLPPSILTILTGHFHSKFILEVTKTEEIILECIIKFETVM